VTVRYKCTIFRFSAVLFHGSDILVNCSRQSLTVPLLMDDLELWTPSKTRFLGPPKPTTQTASRSSRSVQPFCTVPHSDHVFHNGPLVPPPQNSPFPMGDVDTHLWFPRPTQILISVTDQPTDRQATLLGR